ncbi:MAG: 23S rRNA (uracil(1939)-C(5))-methyltransferase RlmD [Oscillospiraceae bacterium]|nr:23S rRNA (uracil(1939)-C(5))-methyltransferase RlmD [Oscillospiraceae bacterium]
MDIQKNQLYEAEIVDYTSEGLGVCRIDGRAVFVKGAVPGEKWTIKILKVTNTAIFAKGEELLVRSPARIESDCPHFGKCGGCALRHVTYEEELRFKLSRVNEAYRRIGGLDLEASEIIGAENTEGYRNKAIFAVGEGGVHGFFRTRSHDIIPIDRCLLQPELADRAAKAVSRFMNEENIPAYNEETGEGYIRHVFTRVGFTSGEAMATIVTARSLGKKTAHLVSILREECPELTSIVLNTNRRRGNTVLDGEFITLWGRSTLRDTLCGLEFELSPRAFYQINPPQAERLYNKALEFAAPEGKGLVLDLYCGAGTISLCLARGADRVIGAEIVPEAVQNARENAKRNNITNAEFICADAGKAAQELANRGLHPDAVVVDPPRKGLSRECIEEVAKMAPERVVYVSCNVATQARDLAIFKELGYTAKTAVAVDMFPRTEHVETVALLSRS